MSELKSGKRVVWSERVEGIVVVALMGVVMVVYGLESADNVFISGW